MEVRQIAVKDLHEWDRNPRKHDVDRLVKSIEAFGFRAPLVVNETPNGYVVEAGHGRLKAAIRLGMETVPCVVVSDDEKTAMAYAVADNRQQELTDWVLPGLKDILGELDDGLTDMESIGYTEKELEDLLTYRVRMTRCTLLPLHSTKSTSMPSYSARLRPTGRGCKPCSIS